MRGEGGKKEMEDDMRGILRRYLWERERESGSVGKCKFVYFTHNRYRVKSGGVCWAFKMIRAAITLNKS